MATVQVRLSGELLDALDTAVRRGIYASRSEALRDALRKLFAPELREDVLLEVIERSRGGPSEFATQREVEEELGA